MDKKASKFCTLVAPCIMQNNYKISGWGYGRVEVHNASYFKYEHVMNNGSVVDRVVIEQDRMYHDDDSKVK